MNYSGNNQSSRDSPIQEYHGDYQKKINSGYTSPQYGHQKPVFNSSILRQEDLCPRTTQEQFPGYFSAPFVGISEIQKTNIQKSKKLGKKKINLEFISDRNRRNVTFSKRKKGIMKKAFELNVLTGSEVLLLVASPSGHVYTFATPKFLPIVNDHKSIIEKCLNKEDIRHQNYLYNIPEISNISTSEETMSLEDLLD